MFSNKDSIVPYEKLGDIAPPFKPTFPYEGTFINERHKYYSTCPTSGPCIQVGIVGWLQQADALKIYELAYQVKGDILELGCHKGLSTSIITQAIQDSGRTRRFTTNDLSPEFLGDTKALLTKLNLLNGVEFRQGDSAKICRDLASEKRKYDFAFVDHCHEYDPVYTVCVELHKVLNPGGFCLFHDYNDASNRITDEKKYGVYKAVADGLDPKRFEFFGIFGCTALYRFNG